MHYHPADTRGAPPQEVVHMGNEITMTSKSDNIEVAAGLIEKEMKQIGWSSDDIGKFHDALIEAIANGIYHGNFGLHHRDLSDEAYGEAMKKAEAEFGDMKKVTITIEEISETHVSVVVADEGKGFEDKALLDPTTSENLLKESGRGVLIMRELVEVEYLGDGNKVRLELPRTRDSAIS